MAYAYGGRLLLHQACVITGLLLLTACAVGKDYKAPSPGVDAQWENGNSDSSAITTSEYAPWWEEFNDTNMAALIEQTIEKNYDLKIAAERIAEAKANERAINSGFFPQIDIVGDGKRGTLGGSYKNRADSSWQSGARGSWDIDAFGGNRRRDEAAQAGIEATEAEAAETRLKLIEEVARNYLRLRGLQRQLIFTQQNIDLQKQTVVITNAQYAARVVTRLDVLRAEAQMNRSSSRIPQIRHEINAVLNRLAILSDSKVATLRADFGKGGSLPKLPPEIIRATPISVMQKRPDINIAERRLAQATALSGAAFAEFFPKISLEGFFGRSGSQEFGAQSPWSAAVNAALPILNFGRIQAQVDAADAREKQAYFGFRQTVLSAVGDVEVAYSAYKNEAERKDELTQVAAQQSEAVRVAKIQYTNGLVPQLDLLDAQQGFLDSQIAMTQSHVALLESAVGLYTALGQSDGRELVENDPNLSASDSHPEATASGAEDEVDHNLMQSTADQETSGR